MRSGHSMRRRLLALLLGAVAAGWAVAAGLTYLDAQREIDTLLDAHLVQAARLVVAQAGREGEEADLDDLDDRDGSPYAATVAFQVWRHDGRLLMRSANAPRTRLSAAGRGFSDSRLGDTHWRVYGVTAEDGELSVLVAEDHATRDRIARRMALNSLLPLAITLPLLGLAIGWVVGRGIRPLRRLGEELAARGPQDLAPVAVSGMPVEVAPLVDRLDQLLARIRESLAAERRFTSHAAHELRTPIAAIRAQAEVARASADPATREAALAHAIEACDRAARLMEQLLLLARLDEALPDSRRARIDLAEAARRVVAEAAPRALAAGMTLGVEGEVRAHVPGDEALIEAALRNLVDNAVRYGVPGTDVRVVLGREGDRVTAIVEDDGPGVTDADLGRLGQRFQRGESALAPGSGLGLSIVASVAATHRGAFTLERGRDGRGVRATLALPRVD